MRKRTAVSAAISRALGLKAAEPVLSPADEDFLNEVAMQTDRGATSWNSVLTVASRSSVTLMKKVSGLASGNLACTLFPKGM